MNKLFFLFFTMNLLAACNNSGPNPFIKKDNTAKTDDKSQEKKIPETNDQKKDKDDDNNRNENKGSWTQNDRDKWLNKCNEVAGNNAQSRTICSCVLEKIEQRYPNVNDAEEATEEEGQELTKECMRQNNDGNGNINGGSTNNDNYNPDDRAWTKLQRQQYIQGCESVAKTRQAGYTSEQIHSYCDCMTSKVERKYSFQQATRMTAADFQAEEWQNAAADCMPRN